MAPCLGLVIQACLANYRAFMKVPPLDHVGIFIGKGLSEDGAGRTLPENTDFSQEGAVWGWHRRHSNREALNPQALAPDF